MRLLSIFSIVLIILSGCSGGQTDDRPAIAVSFEPQAWLLKQIAGDDLDIVTLLPPGSDPETYQPSISTLKHLGKVDVFFTLETSGFEHQIIENLNANFPDLKTIDCSARIEKITGTHYHESLDDNHNHETEYDPHVLASYKNSIIIAEDITKTLMDLYPDKAEKYRKNGEKLKMRLQAKDDSITKMGISGKSFALRHPSLSYFARDYGLTQIPLQSDSKEASPLQLRKRMEEIKESGTKVFIIEKEHASPGDKETALQLGLKPIDVSLNSNGWEEFLMKIAHEINRD